MSNNSADMLFRYLPIRISQAVHLLPNNIFESVNEIRLRKNAPISLTAGNNNLFLDESGRLCNMRKAMRITDSELEECVSKLTNGSFYTCDRFVAEGFIPLAEGGRAGVCGRAKTENGKITGFAEIYSINLRLHRFLPRAAEQLINEFSENGIQGTLVCSPPALGKTTFLRSAIYLLATGQGISPQRIGVADQRLELSAGIADLGIADIISGAPKGDAISLLTRTMAPQIIVCDEIGVDECDAVIEAQNTGVYLIASAHCKSPKELQKRGRLKALLDSGIFPLCAVLGYDGNHTCTIAKTEDFL